MSSLANWSQDYLKTFAEKNQLIQLVIDILLKFVILYGIFEQFLLQNLYV